MPCEWDSAKFYAEGDNWEGVYRGLKLNYDENSYGSKLIFIHNGSAVYYACRPPYFTEEDPGSVVFICDREQLTIYPDDAKFRVRKREYSECLFLEKIKKDEQENSREQK